MSLTERTWRVGELATATDVSVRTLRHYDEIGLLPPSARDGTGPRRYTPADVVRLRHVLTLRGLGLALADIADVLDGATTDLDDLLTRQLLEVERRITAERRVHRVLRALLTTVTDEAPALLIDRVRETADLVDRIAPHQRRRLEEGRRRMLAERSDDALDDLSRGRREAMAWLSPDEYAVLVRRRAAVLTDESEW